MKYEIRPFTPEELDIFESEWSRMISYYSKYSKRPDGTGSVTDLLEANKENILAAAQSASLKLRPISREFEGLNTSRGYGMRQIRPDDIVPAAQGRTFDAVLSGLTPNSWYGYIHNGAIGDTFDDTPLYPRKELATIIVGFLSVKDPIVDEMQWIINNLPYPVWNMVTQMHAADVNLFELSEPIFLYGGVSYRSQIKVNSDSGNLTLIPIGVTFVLADYNREIEPPQPSTVAP